MNASRKNLQQQRSWKDQRTSLKDPPYGLIIQFSKKPLLLPLLAAAR
jgi:hypothetical protein